jgi:hypothetical protein
MAIRLEHIHIDSITPETAPGHEDGSRYVTVTFRVFEPHHPNTFLVPVSVNIDQFEDGEVEDHARYVFHHFMRTLSETTRAWDRLDSPAVRA